MKKPKQSNDFLEKYKPYIGIFIYLITVVITYFVGDYFYRLLQKQENRMNDLKQEIKVKVQNEKDLTKIKSLMPDFPTDVKALDNLILTKSGIGASQFLAQVEQIAKKSNVTLNSLNPQITGETITADIQVTGTKKNVEDFLKAIENNKLIMNVQSVNITLQGNNTIAKVTVKTGD